MRISRSVIGILGALAVSVPCQAAEATLADAVKAGDRASVRALLQGDADVNLVLPDGSTALHWAVQGNDLDTTDLLLRSGANASAVSRYGVTPLALAALNANAAMVERLLAAGADARSTSPEGQTVLMTAARSGSANVVRLLLQRQVDPNVREGFLGQTALMWAAAENHADVVGMLLEAGASPHLSDRIFADHELKPDDFGTPKAPTSKGGLTALHYAARQGALDAVRILVDKGADLDQTDPDGINALLFATINGHTDVAALLLEKGANPNIADTFGRTVLYESINVKNVETVAPRPAPRITGQTTPIALTKLAIDRGAALNAQIIGGLPPRSTQGNNDNTPVGATPLWRAAKSSDVEAVRLLLSAGADPLMPAAAGVTPLMVAAGQGWMTDWTIGTEEESVETVRALLAAGADVNARNTRGETALHGAADRGAEHVVQFLAESGADLALRDTSNRTALDVAMGVPPAAGRSPFSYRSEYGSEMIATLLRELMTQRGVPIEPYAKPGDGASVSLAAGQ
jgi:ankyrin repeat protein